MVNEPCPNKTIGSDYYNNGENWKRCLGNQPDVCIHSWGKFHIIIISRKDVIQWQTQNKCAIWNHNFALTLACR